MKKETLEIIQRIERQEKRLDRIIKVYSWIVGIAIGSILAYLIDSAL